MSIIKLDKLSSTNRTKIYLFLCFWFIYLEEYRLYLETMNGTIKSIKFLFKNRTVHAISLLSIYIYIVSTREENPDYFPLWKKFFILSEEWNEIRAKGKFSIEFVSLLSSNRKSPRSEIDSTFILCENKQRLLFELLQD